MRNFGYEATSLSAQNYADTILARNVHLFSMIADKQPHTTTIWNIFFHIYLDNEQCRKLVQVSGSLGRWAASPYGALVKMCTEYTLIELQRHWLLYIDVQELPRERAKAIRDAFTLLMIPKICKAM